ncbi:MAG TPA: glycosyltransferase family 4 protein, partial [Microlunatus sp.]|nr:glycosyltransferase family 4 protein [Microlunatus sp.]
MTGLRVGLVCPYSFDRPGGVQNHVLGLARALGELGHRAEILAPGDLDPDHRSISFTSAGPALPVPYNGSVARVSFGPVTAGRVRRWLRDRRFDLVHLHEPITPSISLLALRYAESPVVATYHTATPRSRTMQVAGDALRRMVEKIDAGIAVSEPARDVVVRHLGRDAVVIPNGFDHASFRAGPPVAARSPWRGGHRPRLTFLGRLDEPRKGLPVLLAALPSIRAAVGDVEVCLAGYGAAPARVRDLPGVRLLGGVDESTKRALLAGTDVFVAPQVARESFGIVVLEALAAGAEVVASDLPAFADLLTRTSDQPSGRLFRRGDAEDLAAQVAVVLGGEACRQPLARERTRRYDWSEVAPAIADVYAAAHRAPGSRRRVDHRERVRRTWTALDEALVRRAHRAVADAATGGSGPSGRRVHRAAVAALSAAAAGAAQSDRERAESDLSRLLVASGLLGPEHDRATLARRLHNDAVAAAVRAKRL